MKLFSEKVVPTFTSSNLNILGVRNFKEIFIDVFEFEINGKKFVAEKVSEHNGLPVVNIPVVLEGKEYVAPFILRRGQIEVLYNKENSTFVKPVLEEVQDLIEQYTDDEKVKVEALIKDSLDNLSFKLSKDIDDSTKRVESLVNEKIINLTTNTIPNIFLKSTRDNEVLDEVKEQLIRVDQIVCETVASNEQLVEDINKVSKKTDELTSHVDRSNNKALSRIGNIKVQLEEAITSAVEDLNTKVQETEERVIRFYSEKKELIENKIEGIAEENKKYIINLINDSKHSLLEEIKSIKGSLPNIVIERADGKQEVNVKGIKDELEKIIGTKFTTEISALKRLIEMSSGGGSVAKQFASGGTMNGTLNVTGQYLSAGVDLLTIFTGGGGGDNSVNTLVRSNSANWDNTYSTVQAYSANWDEAYNTSVAYQANSASYATIDFTNTKFFPLTGGTITGATVINNNLTVNGNLTATGTTTFNNTVFSVTSALSVVHIGSGPAVWVGNNGLGDIASFYDIDQNIEVLHVGGINSANPNVGVKTSTPNKTFTVVGEISSTSDITTSGKIYIQGDSNSDQWSSTYTNVQSNSGNYILNGGNTVSNTLSVGTNSDQGLILETNGITRMSITSGGLIGFGTRTPIIAGSNTVMTVSGGASNGTILLVRGSAGAGGSIFQALNNSGVGIRISETGQLYGPSNASFGSGGGANLSFGGINNTNVFGSANSGSNTATDFLFRGGTSNRTAGNLFQVANFNIPILTITANTSSGNVGIGTTSPNKTFTVIGQISSTSDITTNGKIYIQDDGNSDQWNSTYTNVQSNSSNWNTAFNISTAYQNESSSFVTNTLLQSTSALLTPLTTTNLLTSQLVLNSTLNSLSGNWQDTYTNVQANSASYATTNYVTSVSGQLQSQINSLVEDSNTIIGLSIFL